MYTTVTSRCLFHLPPADRMDVKQGGDRLTFLSGLVSRKSTRHPPRHLTLLFTVHEISPFYLEGRTPSKDKMLDGILSDIPIGALQYGVRIVTLIVAAGADPSYGFHTAHSLDVSGTLHHLRHADTTNMRRKTGPHYISPLARS